MLPVLMFLIAATSLATAQQRGSAGEKRPKLEVLQSLPEEQLFPLMNVVATSLGVRCDYCHVQATPDLSRTPSNAGGWVWDRDDKLPKRRAREMMKMVVALNAANFRGEARVTCYTCHRGVTRPAQLPVLPPAPPGSERSPTPTPLPSAAQVWTTYVAAVGRAETPAPNSGTVIRGWDDRPEGRYARFEVTVAGSDRYHLVLAMPEGTRSQGLDGAIAWVAANGRVLQLTSPADIARMRRIARRYRPVKDEPTNLRIVGIERVAGRDAYVLQGRLDSVTTLRSYIDVVTGLLRREIITTETLLIPLIDQVEYDDYRSVNGVQMPFRIRTSDAAPYSTSTQTIVEIRRGVPVNDTLFRLPATPR